MSGKAFRTVRRVVIVASAVAATLWAAGVANAGNIMGN
jgi:hypothetical protein